MECAGCGNVLIRKKRDIAKRPQYCSVDCYFAKELGIPDNPNINSIKELREIIKNQYSEVGADELAVRYGIPKDYIISYANQNGLTLNKDAAHRIIHSKAQEYMIENNPMKRPEVKRKVAQWWIDHPEDYEKRQRQVASGRQRVFRQKASKPELRAKAILEALSVTFTHQFAVKKGFIVDFRIDKIILQIDGEYWHGHPRFAPLTERQLAQQKRDRAQDAYLTACGYTVIRIWEHDLSEQTIRDALAEHGLIK